MLSNRTMNSIVAASFALCFHSAAFAVDADGWFAAPVAQTVYYPLTTTVYYSQPAEVVSAVQHRFTPNDTTGLPNR